MKNSEFKNLQHCIGGHRVACLGKEVTKGYKPDLIVKDTNGQLVFIVECEQKTDRKAFLGDLVKAEKYAEECRDHPVLVIVMKAFNNTTVEQIAVHLAPYADWLARRNGGALCLSDILIVSDEDYKRSIQAGEVIGSVQFRGRAICVTHGN